MYARSILRKCAQSGVWGHFFFNTVNPHFYDPNSSISYANLKKTKHFSHVKYVLSLDLFIFFNLGLDKNEGLKFFFIIVILYVIELLTYEINSQTVHRKPFSHQNCPFH